MIYYSAQLVVDNYQKHLGWLAMIYTDDSSVVKSGRVWAASAMPPSFETMLMGGVHCANCFYIVDTYDCTGGFERVNQFSTA